MADTNDTTARSVTYPRWIKTLFCGGLLSIAGSLLSVFVAVFVSFMPGTDVLLLPALAGLAALYAVASWGERRAHPAATA